MMPMMILMASRGPSRAWVGAVALCSSVIPKISLADEQGAWCLCKRRGRALPLAATKCRWRSLYESSPGALHLEGRYREEGPMLFFAQEFNVWHELAEN